MIFGCVGGIRSLSRSLILKFEKTLDSDQDSNFQNRSGVGVWKCDYSYLFYELNWHGVTDPMSELHSRIHGLGTFTAVLNQNLIWGLLTNGSYSIWIKQVMV